VIFDSALLHITLAHISMSLCALSNTKLSPDAIFHVGQAIAIVNKRIAKRYKAISDDTIFAITVLTSLEVRTSPVSKFFNSLYDCILSLDLGNLTPKPASRFISMVWKL
jgi:hypothetical protein